MGRTARRSHVEIEFVETADGLLLDKIVLHPANASAERDLRRFLARFGDPALDLELRAIWERGG